jgi:Photosynthetic reaction centre cytochrome C subunit
MASVARWRCDVTQILLLILTWATPGFAQPVRQARPLENITVLKGWTGADVRDEMRRMSDALGVKCDHCHVQGNFPSDEKRAKRTGRRMLELALALNAESFASYQPAAGESKLGRVTCYTCHGGATTPRLSAGVGGFE